MPNSFSKIQTLSCMQCGETFEAEAWLIIDSSDRPDLVERIRNETLQTLSCPICGCKQKYDSSLLVFRPEKKPPIFYVPAQNLSRKEFERDAGELVEHLRESLGAEWQDEWEQGMQTTSYRFISAELSDNKVATLQEQVQTEIEELQRENPEVFQQLAKTFQLITRDMSFLQEMQVFIQAETWDVTRQVLVQNPRLLSEEGQSLLDGMLRVAELQNDNVGINFLGSRSAILRVCRKLGVELGIELLTQTRMAVGRIEKIPSHRLQELNTTILTFVGAKIWEKYELLMRKPELLGELADDLLLLGIGAALNAGDEDMQLAFENSRSLFRKCREMGIEKGFSQVLGLSRINEIPELDIPLKYKLKLMRLSEGVSVENLDLISKSFADPFALIGTPSRRMSADFEKLDPQALNFIKTFWKHIIANPDLTNEDLDFQSYVWRIAGELYDNLYQITFNLADLEQSVAFYRKAIKTDALPLIDLFFTHVYLSNTLDRRYEHLRLPSDLEESIKSIRQAMEIAQGHNLDELVIALNIYSDSLRKLFWQTNQVVHLEKAVQVLIQVIESSGNDSRYQPTYYDALVNLSNIYGDLFEVTGQFEYLNEAIRTIRIVVDDEPNSPALNDYGNLLMDRFDFAGKVDDLDRAIHAYEKAISTISPNHHMTPAIYGNLGRALLSRYQQNWQMEDIRKAIALSRRAVKMLPENALGLAGIIQGLSSCLLQQFLHIKKKRQIIIDEAVRFATRAIKLTNPESPDYCRYLTTLGNCLKARYEYTFNLEDLTAAVDTYRRGCEAGTDSIPFATWASAQNWGQWAFQRKDWGEVIEAMSYARPIADNLIRNQTLREDKANWVSQIGNLYTLLSYAYIQSGNVVDAVNVLEEGRTRLMRESLERQRKDFARLLELGFGELHERFAAAVLGERELQGLLPEHRKKNWLAQIQSVRREIEETSQLIRTKVGAQHPEYRFFLRSLPFNEIQKLAQNTPLVYLFATPLGGMAIIIRFKGMPQIVELPELTDQTLWNHVVGQIGAPGYFHAIFPWRAHPMNPIAFEKWKAVLDETLAWLWQALMGTLASALANETKITLIPSGLLETLPLQAAWQQIENQRTNRHYFLDQFTVAYVPSAQALYYANLNTQRSVDSLLAVEDPDGELTYSQGAVKFAQSLFPTSLVLRKEAAQLETVREKLVEYNILYFFTHGKVDFDEPLQSGLLLADGKHLTLRDIFNLNIDQTRLAVLSACESGLPADLKQLDEVVSLPGGFLQAGVPGVLGSYWPVLEISTAILMTIFFDQWRKHNLPPPDALRKAQIILRNATRDPNAQKYFQDILTEVTASSELGADILHYQMRMSDYEHPFFWAAFSYHGI